jgi:paraquat-inducible protein B
MSKKASPTVIGAFTLIGLLIAGTALVLFGAGSFFKKTHKIMLYFDKSANGLQMGSDVRFGGVRIGHVNSIKVFVDPKANRKIIPVVVEFEDNELQLIGSEEGGDIDLTSEEGVKKAVKKGLRAGMKQQSLVTGQLYIEFDIIPKQPGFIYHPLKASPYPVVPTVGTAMDELISGIADGLKKFNALDLDGVMRNLNSTLENARNQIAALNMKEINDNVISITKDVKAITGDEKLKRAVTNLDAALKQIDELSQKANTGIDPLLAERMQVSLRSIKRWRKFLIYQIHVRQL